MSGARANVHGTVIVAGTHGILFTGPSGAGKSRMAFACLREAQGGGEFSALVADDRVFLSVHGGHVLAERPDTIRGLIELRHGGIARLASQSAALLHYAVRPVDPASAERLPSEDEHLEIEGGAALPLFRLPVGIDRPLAFLEALFSTRAGRFAGSGAPF